MCLASSGNTMTLMLEQRASTSLRTLVEQVTQRSGVASSDVRLLFGGKQLSLSHTPNAILADFNVQPGATLHLVHRLRGGSRIAL